MKENIYHDTNRDNTNYEVSNQMLGGSPPKLTSKCSSVIGGQQKMLSKEKVILYHTSSYTQLLQSITVPIKFILLVYNWTPISTNAQKAMAQMSPAANVVTPTAVGPTSAVAVGDLKVALANVGVSEGRLTATSY